jgi:hypothetical protein
MLQRTIVTREIIATMSSLKRKQFDNIAEQEDASCGRNSNTIVASRSEAETSRPLRKQARIEEFEIHLPFDRSDHSNGGANRTTGVSTDSNDDDDDDDDDNENCERHGSSLAIEFAESSAEREENADRIGSDDESGILFGCEDAGNEDEDDVDDHQA